MIGGSDAWVNFRRSEAHVISGVQTNSFLWFPEDCIERFSYLAELDRESKFSKNPAVPRVSVVIIFVTGISVVKMRSLMHESLHSPAGPRPEPLVKTFEPLKRTL